MKRLIYILFLFACVAGFGQKVITYGGKPLTYSGKVLTYTTGYCPEYQTVYDAFTTKPDATRSGYYNTAVKALVDGGWWARSDIVRLYANHINTAGEALINWKNPGTFGATAFNAPIHTADQGFLFNGTTQYINNNFVLSVSGVNFTQNSASQILYIRTNISVTTYHGILNSADSKDCAITTRQATNVAIIRTNDATSINAANANGSGLYFNTRTAAAVNKLYRNGTAIINGTTASTGVPTKSPYTGCYNDDNIPAGWRADQVAIEIWMDGCSQADVTAITTILNALMTSLGTNVFSPNLIVFLLMLSIYIANRKKFNEKSTVDIDSGFRMAA